MSSNKNTINALLRRGVDSVTAARLIMEDYTLQSLQVKKVEELFALGLTKTQVRNILDSKRPPIPEDVFNKVLHDSKWVCCICREQTRGIILHHIVEWSKSRSHDYDNLAILCLLHHDEAHTSKELTLMLSPERIREQRNIWYEQVRTQDRKVLNPVLENYETIDEPQMEVTVENIQELILAVKSNTIIKLKKGKYNLSDIAKYNLNENVRWVPQFNGYEPHFENINNLKIIGGEDVELLIDASYTWVMKFNNCNQLTIENITAGHTTPGYCTGGVFMFESCSDININHCDLYGSGTYGMEISYSKNFNLNRTVIRNCTYGILQFRRASDILFRNCKFNNCEEFDLIAITDYSEKINFLNCEFENNYISWDERSFIETDLTCNQIVFEYSKFYNNKVKNWVNVPNVITTMNNEYEKNDFEDPKDKWYYENE